MSFRTYKPGIMSTGHYIISGTPFMTSSMMDSADNMTDGFVLEFPSVTKSITVVNKALDYADPNFEATDTIVYFQSKTEGVVSGSGEVMRKQEYVTLQGADASLMMTIRTRKLFLSVAPHATGSNVQARFEVFAELTGIVEDVEYNQVD